MKTLFFLLKRIREGQEREERKKGKKKGPRETSSELTFPLQASVISMLTMR